MPISSYFLTLAIILVWLPDGVKGHVKPYAWPGALLIAVMLALYAGQLDAVSLIPISIFALICYLFGNLAGVLRLLTGIAIILFSLALGLHQFPGFHNPLIVEQVQLSSDSLPYSLHVNFDKALIGLFILRYLHPLITSRHEILVMLKQLIPVIFVTVVLVTTLSLLSTYVRLDIKFPDFIAYWLWVNLFYTCVAEEALFRGFLQRQLGLLFANLKYGAVLALVICAMLFGLAHAGGGIKYVLLATVAGLGYGWAYYRTQRIEASILLHFILNSMHILLFSYPALAPGNA